ncbi:MAG: NAD(P)-dependent oxidoreductase [Spirochaetales bacterium]|nr:NAD(P)-dependent oxidoreductase [Spirochaetales bacterium]
MSPVLPFPEDDLNNLLTDNKEYLAELAQGTVLLTGGTGFIGKWFLSLFAEWNRTSDEKINVWIPSRNPRKFLTDYPHLETKEFLYFEGDIRSMTLPEGSIATVIHAATDVGDPQKAADYTTIFDVCVNGTNHLLKAIKGRGVKRFLLLSSGAVYGKQDPDVEKLREDSPSTLDVTKAQSAYGEGKRVSEWLVAQAGRENSYKVSIARVFALIGPGIPLTGPFAAGNFINNAINNLAIAIKGNGKVTRSYLYISDLISWLFKLTAIDESVGIYNVGSDIPYTILDLAEIISNEFLNHRPVVIENKTSDNQPNSIYIPSIDKIKNIGAVQKVDILSATRKTYFWYLKQRGKNAGAM